MFFGWWPLARWRRNRAPHYPLLYARLTVSPTGDTFSLISNIQRKQFLKPRIFEFNYVHTHLATNTITTPRSLFLGYLIHICQISERIIHVRLSFMDANWMSSFADKARTVRSTARVRDEAEGGRRATVSAVAADSCWRTDGSVHSIADSAAALDKRAERPPAASLSTLTMRWGASREWRFRCAPIVDAGTAPPKPRSAFRNNSNRHRPSYTCSKKASFN